MKILFGLLVVILLVGCGQEDKNEKILKEIRNTLKKNQIDLSVPVSMKNAQGVKVPEEIKSVCEKFLGKIVKKDYSGAFFIIKSHSGIPAKELDRIEAITKSQISMMKPRFGDYLGYEFVKSIRVSNSLIKFIYITKMENHALRWMFVFYRPKKKWFLNNITWDDKIQLLD